jgi:acetyl esterase/lipase
MITISALMLLLNHSIGEKPVVNFTKPFNKYLVSAEAKSTLTSAQLKTSYPSLSHLIKNGFTAYRLTYNTTGVDGKAVVASGAVFIPDIDNPLPLLNYNHGTYFPSDEKKAPSYLPAYNAEMQIGKLFSASGYLAVLPDYIGYGSTKDYDHPYGAYNIIATSSIDMLRAVKELCEQKKIQLSGRNFFSGWSEGAAVSLAVVRKLESDHPGEFTPTATVANAGPYYSSAFVDHILDSKEPLTYMSTYAWVLQAYNWIYGINKPYEYYFTEPAASKLKKNMEAYISHDPSILFTEEFRKSFKAGKETALAQALSENDLWNWKPVSKVVLCHGDKDDYVPIFNSEKAYKEMKARGADVTLKIFKGHSHSSGAFSYLNQAFSTFEALK